MNSLQSTLGDTYRYREVLYNLVSRDLKLKYKRTLFGYFWSLLNPILQLTVLTVVFSHMVKMGGMKNYSLYLFAGMVAWNFFSGAITGSAGSLLENEGFIKKIYMPKLIFPLSKLAMGMVDFLFSLVALLIIALVAGFPVKPTVVLLPFAIVLLFIFSLGLSIFFSVFTVYFRDVQYLLGVGMQLLYFGTPVIYPIDILPPRLASLMWLNPVYYPVSIFQKLIYAGELPTLQQWGVTAGVALMSLFLGLFALSSCEEDLVFRM